VFLLEVGIIIFRAISGTANETPE